MGRKLVWRVLPPRYSSKFLQKTDAANQPQPRQWLRSVRPVHHWLRQDQMSLIHCFSLYAIVCKEVYPVYQSHNAGDEVRQTVCRKHHCLRWRMVIWSRPFRTVNSSRQPDVKSNWLIDLASVGHRSGMPGNGLRPSLITHQPRQGAVVRSLASRNYGLYEMRQVLEGTAPKCFRALLEPERKELERLVNSCESAGDPRRSPISIDVHAFYMNAAQSFFVVGARVDG